MNIVSGRNAALDTYKLLLSITVVVLHTRYAAHLGYLSVDSFFLINGLMFSQYRQESFDWKKHFLKRLGNVYLPYCLIVSIGTVFEYAIEHNKNYLIEYLPHLFFMTPVYAMRVEMPFSISPLWYVFPYLVALLVFHILLEYVGERKLDTAALLIGLLSFLSIIAKTESGGWNFSYDRGLFGVLPIGYLRAFMGFSIGYLVGRGVHIQAVKEWIGRIPIPVVTVLQMTTLCASFAIMYLAPIDWIYDPLYLILSAVLIALLAIERGGGYKLMCLVPHRISKYSTSIYFVHALVIFIFTSIWGKWPDNMACVIAVLGVVAVIAALFDILVHEIHRWILGK